MPGQATFLPTPEKSSINANTVRDIYAPMFEQKYGCPPSWGAKQAVMAKKSLVQIAHAAERFRIKGGTTAMISAVCSAYLADTDPFLVNNAHDFIFIGQRVPKYVAAVGPIAKSLETKGWTSQGT